jgi:hypothetical protein
MNWKGFERNRSWPNRGTIPEFPGGAEDNHEILQDSRCLAEIRTEHLTNTSLEPYRCTNLLSFMVVGVTLNYNRLERLICVRGGKGRKED